MIESYLNDVNDRYVHSWLLGRALVVLEKIALDKVDPLVRKNIEKLLYDMNATKKYFEEKNDNTNKKAHKQSFL